MCQVFSCKYQTHKISSHIMCYIWYMTPYDHWHKWDIQLTLSISGLIYCAMGCPWNYRGRIQGSLVPEGRIKGAMRFGTFKSIDFKEKWYVKAPVVPRSLMLYSKSCFCYLILKFAFLWEKNIIHKQSCAQMRGWGWGWGWGVTSKPGFQASAIRKASLHTNQPPMCLKMLCKCTMI